VIGAIGLAVLAWLRLKLSGVTLTRIGIILDFVAAFLVAPELLGNTRLAWIEQSTAALAQRIIENAPKVARRTVLLAPGAVGFPFRASLSYVVVGGLSGWLIYCLLRLPILVLTRSVVSVGDLPSLLISQLWAVLALSFGDIIPLGMFLILSSANLAVLESRWLYERVDRRDPAARTIANAVSKLLWITLFPGHFLIGVTNLLIGFPALWVSRIAGGFRRALEQKGGTVGLMLPLGIATFIVAQLCQFLGTF
jgi:hypothetical protein